MIAVAGHSPAPGTKLQDSEHLLFTQMKKKVLIIDDEKDICLLLKRVLELNDYEVSVAGNLKEGEEKILSFSPSYVILDVNLPDGNGDESLQHFKAEKPDTAFILISANNNYLEDTYQQLGASAFLQKPFQLQELLNILRIQ